MGIAVFIVDDVEDVRIVVRNLIEAHDAGLVVSGEASDGYQALERLDDADPAVIVLDERMPGIDGLETATRILERRPGLPMILFTAFLDDTLRSRAADVGIRMCMTKDQIEQIPQALCALVTS